MSRNDWFAGSPVDPFAGLPGCWQPGRWSTSTRGQITITDPDTGLYTFLLMSTARYEPEPPPHIPVYVESDVTWRDRHQPLTFIDPTESYAEEDTTPHG